MTKLKPFFTYSSFSKYVLCLYSYLNYKILVRGASFNSYFYSPSITQENKAVKILARVLLITVILNFYIN